MTTLNFYPYGNGVAESIDTKLADYETLSGFKEFLECVVYRRQNHFVIREDMSVVCIIEGKRRVFMSENFLALANKIDSTNCGTVEMFLEWKLQPLSVIKLTQPNQVTHVIEAITSQFNLYISTRDGLNANLVARLDTMRNMIAAETTKLEAIDLKCVFGPHKLPGKHCNRNEFHLLTTENIFLFNAPSVYFLRTIGYSDFSLDGILNEFDYNKRILGKNTESFVGNIAHNVATEKKFMKLVKDEKGLPVDNLAVKVEMTKTYLQYFASLVAVNPYSEANRRIGLNFILVPAFAPSPTPSTSTSSPGAVATSATTPPSQFTLSLDAEHAMEGIYEHRIGNGPLDYYVQAISSFPIIVNTVRSVEEEEEEESEEEEEVARARRARIDSSSSQQVTIIEAKCDVTPKALKDSLGQLFAQMIDGLKSPLSRKRKRSASGEEEREKTFIKGILSTGQQVLFFSMSQLHDASKPSLEYHGKLFVNYLPKQTLRESGLLANEEVSADEIRKMLIALYNFSRMEIISHGEYTIN